MNRIIVLLMMFFATNAFAEGWYYAGGAYNFVNDDACVGAWAMANDETTEQDMSDNNEDLSQNGTIPTASDVPSGYSGTSRVFDRTADPHDFLYHADGGSTDIATSASGTISIVAWVKTASISYDQMIVAKGTPAGTDGSYFLRYDESGDYVEFGITPNATPTWTVAQADSVLPASTWTHIAAVSNDTDMRIYINGVLDNDSITSYTSGIYNNSGVFRVGSLGGSNHYNGSLKDVAVFSRALTADEVASIYNFGLKGDRS